MHNICVERMPEYNLKVNATKTERTKFYLEEDCEQRGSEEWRKAKTLGSLAGSVEDVKARFARASQVFRQLYSFFKSTQPSLHLKVRLYNCYVKSVLLYNGVTWGLTEAASRSLDVYHRNHLRALTGVKYPNKISNEELYTRYGAQPVSTELTERRWQFFGHVLRLPLGAPPQIALDLAVSSQLRGRRGRPRTTLLTVLRCDCRRFAGVAMRTANDLDRLRSLAADRKQWRRMMERD